MANIKISDLTAAAAVLGTQEFEVNDSLTSKKVTAAQILAYINANAGAVDLTSAQTITGVKTFSQPIVGSITGSAATATSATSATTATNATGTGTAVNTTATQTLTNKTISKAILNNGYTEEVFAITDGTTVNLDPNNGTIQLWTLGANRSPTATNFASGQSMTLMIADGTAFTITWPSVTWVGGTAPTLATTGYTVIELWKVGTTLYGGLVGSVA